MIPRPPLHVGLLACPGSSSLGTRIGLLGIEFLLLGIIVRRSCGASRSQQSRWRIFVFVAVGRFRIYHGAHSEANPSSVLLGLSQLKHIIDRVLRVPAYNATNNNTLISAMQGSIQSLDLGNNTPIIRVPCIAHVIQLSLKQLLRNMKGNLRNETAETIWSDSRLQELATRQHT